MKVIKVNQILKDPAMQDRQCNFKLTNNKGQSKLDYIIEKLESIDSRLCVVESDVKQLKSDVRNINIRLDGVEQRLDNLVDKNNLIE